MITPLIVTGAVKMTCSECRTEWHEGWSPSMTQGKPCKHRAEFQDTHLDNAGEPNCYRLHDDIPSLPTTDDPQAVTCEYCQNYIGKHALDHLPGSDRYMSHRVFVREYTKVISNSIAVRVAADAAAGVPIPDLQPGVREEVLRMAYGPLEATAP